jgi:tetratricopeptide (TPR) repeat protein
MEEIQSRVRRFARSQRQRMLFVLCEPENSPLLLKSIDAVEEDENVPDIFLSFAHAFNDAATFVDEIINLLQQQQDRLNTELAKLDKPQLRSGLSDDASASPVARLVRAMRRAREIVPKGSNVVWVLYPLEITNRVAYGEFIRAIYERLGERALRTTRVIARDSARSQIVAPHLEDLEGVQVYRPQLDLASLEKGFAAQANDPATPVEEQAELHMLLAGMDVANGRHDQALQRNLELLGYFRHAGQKHQESITLNNIGDIYYLNRQYSEAQSWYERALAISVQVESQSMVMYQSINEGNALMMQRKFEEALNYYRAAEQLAQLMGALPYQVQALELMGHAHKHAGQAEEAEQAWRRAVELSKQSNYDMGQRTNLKNLLQLYQENGDSEQLHLSQREMALLATSGSEAAGI